MKQILFRRFAQAMPRIPITALLVPAMTLMMYGCAVKPDPISLEGHQKRVEDDRSALYAGQEPISAPLTLEMAVARSLKYNYDHRLAIMEAAFHDQELTAATWAMLPKLAGNAGYSWRDNESASSSISYRTRKQTLEPSVSSEQERRTADLTLTWNVLDFGLSYFQSKQQADRLLIMQERKRRVINNMVKEVISAYWSTLMAEKLLPQVEAALKEANGALRSYDKILAENLSPPLGILEQYRDLLSIINALRRIQADLGLNRAKLAALINMPLTAHFSLAPPDARFFTPPAMRASLEELETGGLAMRPDLREEAYQERIDINEARKEIVRMLPGVSLFSGINFDANKFLVHNAWSEIGGRVTMDLFNLVHGPLRLRAAEAKAEVSRTRRLAQTVAALVQIHLSWHQYRQAVEDFAFSRKVNELNEKIHAVARHEFAAEAQNRLSLVRHALNALRAQIDKDRALADVYLYWGNMFFSVGGDLVPAFFEDDSLPAMAQTIYRRMDAWRQGELPFLRAKQPDATICPPSITDTPKHVKAIKKAPKKAVKKANNAPGVPLKRR